MMLESTEERECSDSLTFMASSSVPDRKPPFDKSSYDPGNFITQWPESDPRARCQRMSPPSKLNYFI